MNPYDLAAARERWGDAAKAHGYAWRDCPTCGCSYYAPASETAPLCDGCEATLTADIVCDLAARVRGRVTDAQFVRAVRDALAREEVRS